MMERMDDRISEQESDDPFYRVDTTARIAVYDDLLSSPRIIEIHPDTTREYINNIASTVYASSKESGGSIPYSIILQVAENFIHSYFTEVVVTVMDHGNTIRFSDQGPGIIDKEKAKTPGYSSATSQMKRIIHGVGSGLPIVSEYIETMHGSIDIDDNMDHGAVVTISLDNKPGEIAENPRKDNPNTHVDQSVSSPDRVMRSMISERGFMILKLFELEDIWGVSDISDHLSFPPSSVYNELKKLEESGLITKLGKKRILTEMGSRFLKESSNSF